MRAQFLRNATLIVRSQTSAILVDPMLGDVGTLPAFSVLRHRRRRNPTVPLPVGAQACLSEVTHGLITHCRRGHVDHLDRAGVELLASRKLPTYCRPDDARFLQRRGVACIPLAPNEPQPFLGGRITPIFARHGHGWISTLMGPGVGYFIELPEEPSLYIAGDTVLTDDVRRVLRELRPDVSIVAAGNASVDVGAAILMSLDEVMEFVALAPGVVVANHLEALNHCPVTREQVATAARAAGVRDKLRIPADGEILELTF